MSSAINLVLFEPQADWTPRLEFPALTGVKTYCVDVETKDPLLPDFGPGTFRKDGHPVGISLALDTGFARYYPFDHMLGGNLPRENVIAFFKDLLKRTDFSLVGANVGYDLEWLRFLGIECECQVGDVQIAEPILDEESIKGYSLNVLAEKWLGVKKDEELLTLAASAYDVDAKAGLWKLHSKYVGPYAEADAELTLRIHKKQLMELKQQGLLPLYNMECDLIKIVLEMRHQGVGVDLEAAHKLSIELREEEHKLQSLMNKEVGFALNVNSADHIARVCGMRNLPIPKTAKGNNSFDKVFLKNAEDKFFKQILQVRTLNKLRKDFVDGIVIKHSVNGRIHAEFHQLRHDDGGTRSGRFSSSNPNLQQIPSRDKVIAPKIRKLFIPNTGDLWAKLDYSQQEPRLLTHYAYLMSQRKSVDRHKFEGAGKVRAAYMADKTMKFYKFIEQEAQLSYDFAKIVTLGICYGEGKDKLARDLGVNLARAQEIIDKFNKNVPWVRAMANAAKERADKNGYVTTLLGRKRRFDLWEPQWNSTEPDRMPRRIEAANAHWKGRCKLFRAYTYKALNSIIQGSAADMTKAAMIQVYNDLGKVPLLQVHDELDFSVGSEYEAQQIQFRMEQAVDMTVPIFADLFLGKHWK